jgi:chemotaxis signal transduction protein
MTDAAPIETCWRRIGTRGDRSCPELAEYLRCMNCPVYQDTAQMLLARLPARLDDDDGASDPTPDDTGTRFNVLLFRLADEWLAIPTRLLDEVAEPRPVHAVPHRRRGPLLGLVNVRGTLTPCVSMTRLLSLPAGLAAPVTARARLLIVKDGARQIALPVDDVAGIHAVREDAVVPAPATLSAAAHALSAGMVDCAGRRAGLLDPTRLLAALAGGIA